MQQAKTPFNSPSGIRSAKSNERILRFPRVWRKRLITSVVGLCLCSVLVEGNVTLRQVRNQPQMPAMVMLAALPQRRVKAETSTALGVEAFYPTAVQQEVAGFTLIELSIVLVIIGLVVGGVLVGRDLIAAAAVRAQISQIEKYQQAVNAFRGKYGYLPGDIPDPDASNFGFPSLGNSRGLGDGNGQIEGAYAGSAGLPRMVEIGETTYLWSDMSKAGLIQESFTNSLYYYPSCCSQLVPGISTTNLNRLLPEAKIGRGNYIIAYSPILNSSGNWINSGINYFGLMPILSVTGVGYHSPATPALSLTVREAFDIDKKIDDGLPQTGNVTAQFVGSNVVVWASGTTASSVFGTADTSATPGSYTTCFDNNNVGGATQQYSITQNNGTGMNCALSFKFQ